MTNRIRGWLGGSALEHRIARVAGAAEQAVELQSLPRFRSQPIQQPCDAFQIRRRWNRKNRSDPGRLRDGAVAGIGLAVAVGLALAVGGAGLAVVGVAVSVVQGADALQGVADSSSSSGMVSFGASAKSVSSAKRRLGSGLAR